VQAGQDRQGQGTRPALRGLVMVRGTQHMTLSERLGRRKFGAQTPRRDHFAICRGVGESLGGAKWPTTLYETIQYTRLYNTCMVAGK
jgi:hypothetical protein